MVDFVRFLAPPFRSARVERIKCVEATNQFGATEINGNREANAPWTEDVGDARELRQEIGLEGMGIGVYIVDGATVDTDRCQQTSVVANPSQVRANFVVLEKNRAASVAAFNAAIQIVPLVGPANRRIGLLDFVDGCKIFAACDLAKQREHAVEDPAVATSGDDEAIEPVKLCGFEPETVFGQGAGREVMKILDGAQDNRASALTWQRL